MPAGAASAGSAASIAPGRLEAAQRRVQRAERDAPERAERLGQPLLQLVAVKWLLGEQSENGELQHEALRSSEVAVRAPGVDPGPLRSRYIESIYRATIARRARSRTARVPRVASRRRRSSCARLYTDRRAQRHGLRARPTSGPARLPQRRAHPPRRVRRPPGADAGGPEHRGRRSATSARCAASRTCAS